MSKEEKAQKLNPNKINPEMDIQDMGDGRRRLRVQFDLTYGGHGGTDPQGVSQTEPDMTLRLGQLLERHSRGRDVPMKTPLFFDTEIPTFNDLTDVDRYKEQLERRLEETNNFIKQEQLDKLEQQHQERIKKTELVKSKNDELNDDNK